MEHDANKEVIQAQRAQRKQRKKQEKKSIAVVKAPKVVKDKSPKVLFQRDNFQHKLKMNVIEWSATQQEFINLVRDPETKQVMLKGPAGSSKTFIAIWLALTLLDIGRVKEIYCVRSLVESSSVGTGFLPGSIGDKMAPFNEPFFHKLRQIIPQAQIDLLIKDKRIHFVPVNHLRGLEFTSCFVIADEIQNFSEEEILLLITRYGTTSKMILCGDTNQSDLTHFRKIESGFKGVYDWFDKPESVERGLRCFKFGIEDIRRDPLVGYIVEEFQKYKEAKTLDYRPGGNI